MSFDFWFDRSTVVKGKIIRFKISYIWWLGIKWRGVAHTRLRARPSEPQGAVHWLFRIEGIRHKHCTSHWERGCDVNMGNHASGVINNMLLLECRIGCQSLHAVIYGKLTMSWCHSLHLFMPQTFYKKLVKSCVSNWNPIPSKGRGRYKTNFRVAWCGSRLGWADSQITITNYNPATTSRLRIMEQ